MPMVIPTACAISTLCDTRAGVGEGELGRGGDTLVDIEKVGKDIDGGNVGDVRNDEIVLDYVMSTQLESGNYVGRN